jgi:hypothetical protein
MGGVLVAEWMTGRRTTPKEILIPSRGFVDVPDGLGPRLGGFGSHPIDGPAAI